MQDDVAVGGGCAEVPNTTPDSARAAEFSCGFFTRSIFTLPSYSRFLNLSSESEFSCSVEDTGHLISFQAI